MGINGQFDIDPQKTGTGRFGLAADGRFMVCGNCCGGCITQHPAQLEVTFVGVQICAGKGVTATNINATFLFPFTREFIGQFFYELSGAICVTQGGVSNCGGFNASAVRLNTRADGCLVITNIAVWGNTNDLLFYWANFDTATAPELAASLSPPLLNQNLCDAPSGFTSVSWLHGGHALVRPAP